MKFILILFAILVPLRMAAEPLICPNVRPICPNVPHFSAPAVCSNVCGTKFLYDHCIDMMRLGGMNLSPSHREEATVYAILAANLTLESFIDTTYCFGSQLENTSLSGPDRDNYRGCIYDLMVATNALHIIVTGLCNCFFRNLDNYMSIITDVETCRDRMLAPKVPPLYPDVMRDRNNMVTAYLLGKLLADL
ncbi:unnamed protein product [Alopecurus aequalis]